MTESILAVAANLLPDLIMLSAQRAPLSIALTAGSANLSYGDLQSGVAQFSHGLMHLGLSRGDRVAIYLDKRFETVIASFGATAAGCVFVPVNPLLKPDQVAHILSDCNVRVLVTSPERLAVLQEVLGRCPDLSEVVVIDSDSTSLSPALSDATWSLIAWRDLLQSPASHRPPRDRHGHGSHSLHLGQHGSSQRRRAVASQHGDGC